MPSLAAHIARTPGPDTVCAMLRTIPERGKRTEVVRAGPFTLGIAADDRLPHESSICEGDGWAAAVVGSLDDHDPTIRSAAETVLESIRSRGPDALDRLRGVFATVVTDGRRAWAARDHIGTETLYYHESPGRLLLASEPKQFAAVPGLSLEPDLDVVEKIFYGEEYDPRRSVYRGVSRLEMAHFLEWSEDGSRLDCYWRPEQLFETARLSPDEIAERFHELMSRAVLRTLRGDDAILLSGGIDSPAVAAYFDPPAARTSRRPIGAISAVFPRHGSVDERSLVEMLAQRYGLELHTYAPGPLSLGRLDEWVRTFDGPWAAWHPGFAEQTYRLAADLGYSNILTGFFAEIVADLSRGIIQHLLAAGRFREAFAYLGDRRARGATRASSARHLAVTLIPRWAVSMRRRRHPVALIPTWMDPKRLGRRDGANAVAPRALWKEAQLGFMTGPQPSMEAYAKLQARCGVRVRHPWADVDLWEFFISLPAELKHPDSRSKALLRNLLRGRVPDEILDRGKIVFDDYFTDTIDYDSLRRWLVNPPVRIAGIEYDTLAERLEAENLPMSEFISAKDLATAHAFLAQW